MDTQEFQIRCAEPSDYAGLQALYTQPGVIHGTLQMPFTSQETWRRRGVGSRLLGGQLGLADRWLNLSRIELTVYTDNVGAIALYEKFGFRREGRLQRYAFRDGEYADVFAMSRLR